jgi:hypothetical protein
MDTALTPGISIWEPLDGGPTLRPSTTAAKPCMSQPQRRCRAYVYLPLSPYLTVWLSSPFHLNLYVFLIEVASRSGSLDPQTPFQLIQSIPLDRPQLVRAIAPDLQLVALSASTAVELIRWGEESDKVCTPIPKYPDDPQDLVSSRNCVPLL